MIITFTDFLNSGLPVSTDIREDEITFAIKTVEQLYVRQMFGDEIWSDICQHPASYSELISGTDTMAGLKVAESHATFAYMLYDNQVLTRYHSIVKKDEYSDNPSRDDLLKLAKHHWEIFMVFVRECAKYAGAPEPKIVNNLIFSELF